MRLMHINGEFTQGSASEAIEVRDPATEEVLEAVPRGTAADADQRPAHRQLCRPRSAG